MNRDIIGAINPTILTRIDSGLCPMCGMPVGTFNNDISRKEFEISGMCQSCQDVFFGFDDDAEYDRISQWDNWTSMEEK